MSRGERIGAGEATRHRPVPNMLRFLGGPAGHHEVHWLGPWPPPERLELAYGHESGIVKVLPDDLAAATRAELEAISSITLTVYRRRNASRFTDEEIAGTPHLSRGAEYVPEEAGPHFAQGAGAT